MPVSKALPSAMSAWSHRLRSWSGNGTRPPAGVVRAARRASVSSMRASNPATSPSPGRAARSWRVSRMASVLSSTRCRRAPDVAVYPSLNTR